MTRRWIAVAHFFLFCASLLLAACDSPANHHATMHGPDPLSPFDVAMRNQAGFELVERYCSACHSLPDPKRHTAAEWPQVIGRMLDNIRRIGKPMPNAEQTNTILEFLQTNAR